LLSGKEFRVGDRYPDFVVAPPHMAVGQRVGLPDFPVDVHTESTSLSNLDHAATVDGDRANVKNETMYRSSPFCRLKSPGLIPRLDRGQIGIAYSTALRETMR
jgi:hypothetical protein